MGSRASSRLGRSASCGSNKSAARIVTALSLSIFQQVLCGKQWIKGVALCDEFGAALLSINDAEGGHNFVSGFLSSFSCFENRIAGSAHVVHDDNGSARLPVPALDGSLSSVPFGLFPHNECWQRLVLQAAHNRNRRCYRIRPHGESADRIGMNVVVADTLQDQSRNEQGPPRIQRGHSAIEIIG